MEIIFLSSIVVLFCIMGWQDFKERKVSTLLISLTTLIFFVYCEFFGLGYQTYAFSIFGLFAYNSLSYRFNKSVPMGWGDIFTYPVFASLVPFEFNLILLPPMIIQYLKKKPEPLVFWLAIGLVTYILLRM